MIKKLLNMKEAVKYIGRTEQTIRAAIKNKEIPCKLFRGGYLFSPLVLDLWAAGLDYESIIEAVKNNITKEIIYETLQLESLAC